MKKISRILLTLAFVLSAIACFNISEAFAANVGVLSNTPFEAEQGERFSTIIYLQAGSNIVDFQTELTYNKDDLKLIDAQQVGSLVGNMEIGTEKEGVIAVNYTRVSANLSNETQLLQLTFEVDNNLNDGVHSFLSYNNEVTEAHTLENSALKNADLTTQFTDVSLYGSGDVNMDNKVSIADATFVRQYLVKMRNLSDVQLSKANTTGNDNTVDIADAVRIQQKLIYDELVLGNRANVTFYVDGEVYAVKSVVIGEDLTNIPKVPAKECYTDGAWDVTDFTDITSSISVNAVYGYTGQTNAGKATYQKVLTALDTGFVQSGKYIADNFQLPYKNTYGTFNMLSSKEFADVDILWSIDSGLLAQSVVIGNDYVVTVPDLDYTTSVTFTAYVYIDGVLYGTQAFDREIKGKIDLPNSNTFKDIIDAIPTYNISDASKLGLVAKESQAWINDLSKKYSSYDEYFYKNMENYRLPGSVSLESDRTNYGVKIVQDVDIVWTLKDGDSRGFDASKNQLIYLKDENPVTLKAEFMFDGYCVYSQTITRTVPAQSLEGQYEYATEYLSKYVPSILSTGTLLPTQVELYDLTIAWSTPDATGLFEFDKKPIVYNNQLYALVNVGTKAEYMQPAVLTANVSRNGDYDFYMDNINYSIKLAGNSTVINNAKVPDMNLYKALVKIFDTKYGNNDGILTEEEIFDTDVAEKMNYTIDLSNREIENLQGINFLTKYRSLNLSGNKLGGTDANLVCLAGLTNLEQINLASCGINVIPRETFASMYSLSGIDISYNNLINLDCLNQHRKYTELTDLFVQGNKVSDISALSYVNGSGEAVSAIPNVKRLTLSRKLDSEDEAKMDITPIGLMKNLTVLWLANNNIDDITPLQHCSLLTTLDLSNNEISAPNANSDGLAPISNLQSLICLSLDDNKLTTVRSLRRLTNLQELSLSNNTIGSFDSLSTLRNLNYLDLDGNNINSFNAGTFKNLNFLYLEDNNLQYLISVGELKNLYQLRLSYNNIHDPDNTTDTYAEIGKLTNLTYLSLSGNPVGDLSFLEGLTALEQLELDNASVNQYYTVTIKEGTEEREEQRDNLEYIGALTNLKVLDLSQNENVRNISALSNLTDLNVLYLDGIQLEGYKALARMSALKYLSMQNSGIKNTRDSETGKITEYAFDFASSLPGLVYFNASGHSADEIDFNNFKYYENIEQLYLDSAVDCKPLNLKTGLANMINIKNLSLRNISVGNIESIPDMGTLEYLNLQNTGITDYRGPECGSDGYIYAIDRFQNLKALFVRQNNEMFTKDNLNFLYSYANKDNSGNKRETPIEIYLYTPDDMPYDAFMHVDYTDKEGKTNTYMAYKEDGLETQHYPVGGRYYEDYVWGSLDGEIELAKIKSFINFPKESISISEAIIGINGDKTDKGYKLPTEVNGFELSWKVDDVECCYIENNTLYYREDKAVTNVDIHLTATLKGLYGNDYEIPYDVSLEYGSRTQEKAYDEIQTNEKLTLVREEEPEYTEYGDWQDYKDATGSDEERRTMYRYYYLKCPACNGRMGIYGHSSANSQKKNVHCYNCGHQMTMSAIDSIIQYKWSETEYPENPTVLNAEAEYTSLNGEIWFVDRYNELIGNNTKTQYRYKYLLGGKKYIYKETLENALMMIIDKNNQNIENVSLLSIDESCEEAEPTILNELQIEDEYIDTKNIDESIKENIEENAEATPSEDN